MLIHRNSSCSNMNAKPNSSGFSLIEMAMVLLIIGLLLNGLLVAIGENNTNRLRTDANTQLEQIREALYGFAQINGRLPCPANPSSAGIEAPVNGGNCTDVSGFIPGVQLNIQGSYNAQGLLVDPWANPYRYAVSTLAISSSSIFTNRATLQSWFSGTAPTGGTWLCVSDTTNCGPVVLASTVPAIVYSLGASSTAGSAKQAENLGATLGGLAVAGDREFVDAQYSEDAVEFFDDILVWLSPNILTSRLVSAGKLP